MTQKELAEAVGVTRQTVNAIGGDYNPTVRLCVAICKALGKTLDELFWEKLRGVGRGMKGTWKKQL